MPVSFHLAKSIYDSPFYWMCADETYRTQATTNRGESHRENWPIGLLGTVFGNQTFRNVQIRSSKRNVAEIDRTCLCRQSRPSSFKQSRNGLPNWPRVVDDEQLSLDFTAAIQDSYNQGLACRRELLHRECSLTSSNGMPIPLPETINDAYVLCLTLDPFPGITSMLDKLLVKGSDDPFPVAMSVFDLEILATYLNEPFEFLYYLRNRVRWADKLWSSSEMALLAFHLNQKLFPTRDGDFEAIPESWSQLIDANYPVIRGQQPPTVAATKLRARWRNRDFDKLVAQLKKSADAGFTDAIFLLYDLSSETADELMQRIDAARLRCGQTVDITSCSLQIEDYGITYICFPKRSSDLQISLTAHCKARKYKSKADKWLGLAGVLDGTEPIEMAVFCDDPWKTEPNLDLLTRTALRPGVVEWKLGRNKPCWCGSGKKFKKCHGDIL